MRLGPAEHLAWVRENYAAVLATPVELLSAPVNDCPGWRVETVVDHLARAAFAFRRFMLSSSVTDNLPEILADLPPHTSGSAVLEIAAEQLEALVETAEALDPESPCRFVTGPGTVATWFWHMAAETWIHRADVAHAVGQHPRLDPDRGLDCLRWTAMFRQLIAATSARTPDPVACVATDAHEVIHIGEPPPTAEIRGSGGDLSLRLWSREHGPLDGDGEAVTAWSDLKIVSPLD